MASSMVLYDTIFTVQIHRGVERRPLCPSQSQIGNVSAQVMILAARESPDEPWNYEPWP